MFWNIYFVGEKKINNKIFYVKQIKQSTRQPASQAVQTDRQINSPSIGKLKRHTENQRINWLIDWFVHLFIHSLVNLVWLVVVGWAAQKYIIENLIKNVILVFSITLLLPEVCTAVNLNNRTWSFNLCYHLATCYIELLSRGLFRWNINELLLSKRIKKILYLTAELHFLVAYGSLTS